MAPEHDVRKIDQVVLQSSVLEITRPFHLDWPSDYEIAKPGANPHPHLPASIYEDSLVHVQCPILEQPGWPSRVLSVVIERRGWFGQNRCSSRLATVAESRLD